MAENPCFKCTHHAAGCHDDCRAYKDWQDRHIAEKIKSAASKNTKTI